MMDDSMMNDYPHLTLDLGCGLEVEHMVGTCPFPEERGRSWAWVEGRIGRNRGLLDG